MHYKRDEYDIAFVGSAKSQNLFQDFSEPVNDIVSNSEISDEALPKIHQPDQVTSDLVSNSTVDSAARSKKRQKSKSTPAKNIQHSESQLHADESVATVSESLHVENDDVVTADIGKASSFNSSSRRKRIADSRIRDFLNLLAAIPNLQVFFEFISFILIISIWH